MAPDEGLGGVEAQAALAAKLDRRVEGVMTDHFGVVWQGGARVVVVARLLTEHSDGEQLSLVARYEGAEQRQQQRLCRRVLREGRVCTRGVRGA